MMQITKFGINYVDSFRPKMWALGFNRVNQKEDEIINDIIKKKMIA